MTSVRQSHVTTMSSNHDNNLDALLEELQTSVSRPGSALGHNMNGMTGYREVTRTVTTETSGQPTAKTSEYQIEYLNPSNTTTVLQEIPHNMMHDVTGRNASGVTSYKTVEYKYNTTGSHVQDAGAPVADLRMRQNITELDSLLDDLHTAQRTGFADSGVSRHTPGIDPGLLEPIESSTPKSSHVSRSTEKRTVQEQRYGSVGHGRSSPAREREVRKELVFTGGSNKRDQPSPSPIARKEIYHYESKTTRSGSANSRDLSPPQDRRQPSPSPARQVTSVRTYNYSNDDVPRTPTMHRSPSPAGVRSSSNTTVRQYNYNNRDFSPEGVRQPPLRSPSPSTKVTTVRNYTYNTPQEPPRNTSSKVTSVNSYSYNSSSRDTRSTQEVPRSPPPHRSPSPVSFIPPPAPNTNKSTTVKTYNFEQSSNTPPYVRPQSPQPVQKFSPSDPSRTLTYQVSPPPPQPSQPTVITYKYSSQSTHSTKYPGEENVPLLPRPFPTPSPTPEQQQQQPPKKLDELMASFSDTDIQHHHESSTRYVPVKEVPIQRTEAHSPAAPPTPPPPAGPSPASTAAAMQVKSKNIAGPPVYYPPGVELFAKKEEAMMMQSQSGGGKYKAKSKYEYEASSKMKSKESSGKTVVPVCLPVCCAMPCVIM